MDTLVFNGQVYHAHEKDDFVPPSRDMTSSEDSNSMESDSDTSFLSDSSDEDPLSPKCESGNEQVFSQLRSRTTKPVSRVHGYEKEYYINDYENSTDYLTSNSNITTGTLSPLSKNPNSFVESNPQEPSLVPPSIQQPSTSNELLTEASYQIRTAMYTNFIQQYQSVLLNYYNISNDFSNLDIFDSDYDNDDIQTIYDICFHIFFLIKAKIYYFYQSINRESNEPILYDDLLKCSFINHDIDLQCFYLMEACFMDSMELNEFHETLLQSLPSTLGKEDDQIKMEIFKGYIIKYFYQ